MSKFPLYFEVNGTASSGIGNTWSGAADELQPIEVAIPPEFGGPGKAYSPEDLFGMAVIHCIIATFKVYAEHAGISFQEIKAKASVMMDKDPSENTLALTSMDIHLEVSGSSDKEKTKMILEKAIKECAVSNSIKTGKTFHINVN